MTRQSWGNGTAGDYATIYYNSAGAQRWVARYYRPVSGNDEALSIKNDGLRNVYMTGKSVGNGTSEDYATIKYDASCIEQWEVRYNGPVNS